MSLRVTLRSPFGPVLTRDIVDGLWAEPTGVPTARLGERMWAVPGLADAHGHLAAERAPGPGDLAGAKARATEALHAGVMLILDKGWTDLTTIQLMDELPEIDRPDIEAAGRIIHVADGYYRDFGLVIDPEGVAQAAKSQAHMGRGWVKLVGDWPRRGIGPVANFDEHQLRAAVEAAEIAGSRVAIHTMARDVPSQAVSAGVHSIEHGLFLTRDDIEKLGYRTGSWVPTVSRMEVTVDELGPESSGGRLIREGLENVRRLLPEACEAGVCVLAGTDLVGAPADVSREALRLSDYGMSAEQVLDAVSCAAFRSTRRPTSFEVGAPADAVLFEESPLEELRVLAHPSAIIRKGIVR